MSNDNTESALPVGERWSSAQVQRVFRFESRIKSRQTLLNAEERGEIPRAERIKRGAHMVRQWKTGDLPAIGSRFGFLKKPPRQAILSFYMQKGGVGKTSVSFTLARTLALNGIRTVIVGLDTQLSITKKALRLRKPETLEEHRAQKMHGLYHFFYDGLPLSEIIRTTDLPTLDVVPETSELAALERRLRDEPRREYWLAEKLIPELSQYDVVVFDNGPSWNLLIGNSLVAASAVISPIEAEEGCWEVLSTNLETLREWQDKLKLEWSPFAMVPTMLERNKLSAQIYASYLSSYPDTVIPFPVRRAVKGQEALVSWQTPFEYDPMSQLASDYFDMITELWARITGEVADVKAA